MQNQLATTSPKPSALATMAGKFNVDPAKLLNTLKNTVFKGASEDELMTLVIVANEYGLNPLTKEIYAFPAKGGGIVPVVSVDGWIRMMNDHPQFDSIDYEWEHAQDGKLVSCTAIIHRKDRQHPTRVTEYLAECRRGTEPWKMEHRMLRHKATIQGARIAFGFSGVMDEDEALTVRDVTPPKASQSKLFRESPALPATSAPLSVAVPAKQAVQPKGAEESTLIDVPALSLAEQVQQRMESDAVTWQQVYAVAVANGITDEPEKTPEQHADETLRALLGGWNQVVAACQKGGEA